MKAYTDLEQSKILSKILKPESADMRYDQYVSHIDGTPKVGYKKGVTDGIPCWSLASLLSVLPNNEHISTTTSRGSWKVDTAEYLTNIWWCQYEDTENEIEVNTSADNLIDACYEMIIKLNELKML